MADSSGSIDVLCRYLVKPDMEQQFAELLRGHWQTLHDAGLTTEDAAQLQQAKDQAGNVAFIEKFAWRNAEAVQSAHESPAVMRLWEPMGALCKDMEFWHVEGFQG